MSHQPVLPNLGIYSVTKGQIIPIASKNEGVNSLVDEENTLANYLSAQCDPMEGYSQLPTTLLGVSAVPKREESIIDNMSKPTAHLWLMGDMQYVTDFLDRWEFCSCMLPLKILNAILRSYGAPMMVNNPISGVLVSIAICIKSIWALIWSLCAVLFGLMVCLMYFQSQKTISSGQPVQNAILLALTGTAAFPYLSLSVSSSLLLYGTLCGLSVLLSAALTSCLTKVGMPSLTISYALFAAMTSVIFTVPHHDGFLETRSPINPGRQEFEIHAKNESTRRIASDFEGVVLNAGRKENASIWIQINNKEEKGQLDCKKILLGTLRGAGKVMQCPDTLCSTLIFVAIFLFSPTMATLGGVGSFLATATGAVLEGLLFENGGDNNSLYLVTEGLYGKQGLLIAMSLGGYFFVFSPHAVLVALSGAIFSTFVTKFFFTLEVPYTTLPHIILTLTLLQVRVRGGHLRQVEIPYLTYPEMHKNVFNRIKILPAKSTTISHSVEESI